jgi:L-2-hydroxyglutarate oxidase LhgO
MLQTDVLIIGAGAVGLAVARVLALAGREVVVIERERAIGQGVTSRNSEVIHAGIYGVPGSLRARLCVEGKSLLYAYARDRGFDAKPIGKLIVAVNEGQIATLDALRKNAVANGVNDLVMLTRAEALAREPQLACVAALWSPSSGIVDAHRYTEALGWDFERAGGILALNSPFVGATVASDGITARLGDAEGTEITCRLFINAAGLHAPNVAAAIEGFPANRIPKAYFAKGNYYGLSGVKQPFTHLVYPVPEQAGLGIHATIDMQGAVRFGPDVEWVDTIDYAANPNRTEAFVKAVRTYWPGLPDGALAPLWAGVRPKISGPGTAPADFMINTPREHGIAGIVNLFGIESPGLTASLAIAEEIKRRLSI